MKKGDVVDIHNMTLRGEPFKEGRATLVRKRIDGERREYWTVLFEGDEGNPVERWVEKERA